MKKLIGLTLVLGLIVFLLAACGSNNNNEPEAPAATDAPAETEEPEPAEEPEPTEEPTAEPTDEPTEEPTAEPTDEPTEEPTEEPTDEPTEEPEPAEVTIDMLDFMFSEITTTIPAGTTITWVNVGEFQHSAKDVNSEWDTGLFDPGLMESIAFDTPGTFAYFCELHGTPDGTAGMVGTIIVTEE